MPEDKLQEILEKHKLWLETNEAEGEIANLSDANLSYANLSDAILRGADLEGADLFEACLRAMSTPAHLCRPCRW